MSRVTDHTRTKKIGGDSILFLVVIQVVAGNRYDNSFYANRYKYTHLCYEILLDRGQRPQSPLVELDPHDLKARRNEDVQKFSAKEELEEDEQ